MRPPLSLPRDLWGVFVADAVWLVDYGVAADALSRGWSPLDLLGVSADEEWQSLAAWIGGTRDEFNRACVLLQEIRGGRTLLYTVQALTSQRRWHYLDPAPPDARLAWTMGCPTGQTGKASSRPTSTNCWEENTSERPTILRTSHAAFC